MWQSFVSGGEKRIACEDREGKKLLSLVCLCFSTYIRWQLLQRGECYCECFAWGEFFNSLRYKRGELIITTPNENTANISNWEKNIGKDSVKGPMDINYCFLIKSTGIHLDEYQKS